MTTVTKNHYQMIAGRVIFQYAPKTDAENPVDANSAKAIEVGEMTLNALVTVNDPKKIILSDIGRCQIALQKQFRQRLPDPNIQIMDAVILSVIDLGYMTEEEFRKNPEGTKLQEKVVSNPPTEEPSEDKKPSLQVVK